MSRDGCILLHPSGRLTSDGLDVETWASPRVGLWRPVPTPADLIILERAEGEAQGGQVTLSGRITAPGDLTDILQMIHTGRWEGLFNVLLGAVRKTLILKEGDVVGAVSNAPEDRIGEVLVRLGMIGPDQRDRAMAQAGEARRLGQVLVQSGLIAPATLYSALKAQVEEIFYSLLLLTDGTYWFAKDKLDKPVWGQLRLSTSGLLLEGVQRMDEMRYFREKIPSSRVVFEPMDPPPRVTLDATEMGIVRVIDGTRDLAEVARAARVTEHVATRACFRLLQAGFIRVAPVGLLGSRGKAARKAGVAEILDVVNTVLERVAEEARQVGRERELRQAPATFYAAATPFSLLFELVELDDAGRLEVEILLDNLAQALASDPAQHLLEALSEFLSYAVFLVCEGLPAEQAGPVRARLEAILREEGMADALGAA